MLAESGGKAARPAGRGVPGLPTTGEEGGLAAGTPPATVCLLCLVLGEEGSPWVFLKMEERRFYLVVRPIPVCFDFSS